MRAMRATANIRRYGVLMAFLASAVLTTGCITSDTASFGACSGSYKGTFNGAGGGTVTGSFSEGGALSLTFTITGLSQLTVRSFSYQVSGITGDFTGSNPDDVSASFDFGACRMSGIWTFHGASGVWSAAIVRE